MRFFEPPQPFMSYPARLDPHPSEAPARVRSVPGPDDGTGGRATRDEHAFVHAGCLHAWTAGDLQWP
jgi:hypothetical protein